MTTNLRAALGIQRSTGDAWWKDAACIGQPFERFFTENNSKRRGKTAVADDRGRRICARCPVRRECLLDALESEVGSSSLSEREWDRKQPAGILGGTTPEQRWADDIAHLYGCPQDPRCRGGCRPLADRVELLEALFRRESVTFLTRTETVVG